jgi:hypothetical protein
MKGNEFGALIPAASNLRPQESRPHPGPDVVKGRKDGDPGQPKSSGTSLITQRTTFLASNGMKH